jgi:hypothetical protein
MRAASWVIHDETGAPHEQISIQNRHALAEPERRDRGLHPIVHATVFPRTNPHEVPGVKELVANLAHYRIRILRQLAAARAQCHRIGMFEPAVRIVGEHEKVFLIRRSFEDTDCLIDDSLDAI